MEAPFETILRAAAKAEPTRDEPPKPEAPKPAVKRRPRFLIDAVSLLVSDTSEGKVGLGALGQYLKRTNPAFSPQTYGHSGLLNMVKTYDLLAARPEEGGHWSVSLVPKAETTAEVEDDALA